MTIQKKKKKMKKKVKKKKMRKKNLVKKRLPNYQQRKKAILNHLVKQKQVQAKKPKLQLQVLQLKPLN